MTLDMRPTVPPVPLPPNFGHDLPGLAAAAAIRQLPIPFIATWKDYGPASLQFQTQAELAAWVEVLDNRKPRETETPEYLHHTVEGDLPSGLRIEVVWLEPRGGTA